MADTAVEFATFFTPVPVPGGERGVPGKSTIELVGTPEAPLVIRGSFLVTGDDAYPLHNVARLRLAKPPKPLPPGTISKSMKHHALEHEQVKRDFGAGQVERKP